MTQENIQLAWAAGKILLLTLPVEVPSLETLVPEYQYCLLLLLPWLFGVVYCGVVVC
jgi:hypothetical protein